MNGCRKWSATGSGSVTITCTAYRREPARLTDSLHGSPCSCQSRSSMRATIEVFWNGEPEVRSEREFLTQLKADLASRNVSATILANFYTYRSSRQVDFLVITDNHVCHVELKNYRGILTGTTNGPWSSRRPDGTLETIDHQNPYDQAVGCKMAISDDLQAVADQDRK